MLIQILPAVESWSSQNALNLSRVQIMKFVHLEREVKYEFTNIKDHVSFFNLKKGFIYLIKAWPQPFVFWTNSFSCATSTYIHINIFCRYNQEISNKLTVITIDSFLYFWLQRKCIDKNDNRVYNDFFRNLVLVMVFTEINFRASFVGTIKETQKECRVWW